MQSEQPRAEQLTGSPQRRRAPYAVVAVLDARDNLLNGGGTSFEHSDALICNRMHSDAIGCNRMQ